MTRENRETIHGDHISITKFSTKDDPVYEKVLNSIEMLLEGLSEDSLITSKQGVLNSCITHGLRNFNHGTVKSDAVVRQDVSPASPLRWLKFSMVVSRLKPSTSSLHFESFISSDEELYILNHIFLSLDLIMSLPKCWSLNSNDDSGFLLIKQRFFMTLYDNVKMRTWRFYD